MDRGITHGITRGTTRRVARRPNRVIAACAAGALACAAAPAAHADDLLRLWGIDADDAQLFAIDDVRNPGATMVDYGPIHVPDGLDHAVITGEIRAFTIVNTFDAFAVVDGDVGSCAGPVLLHIDLHDIGTAGPVTAEVIGSMLDAGWDPSWTVTGIAGDPLYAEMYILGADGDPSTDDRLARAHARIDRTLSITPVGDIRWDRGRVTMGGDLTMGPAGLLLVSDEAGGRIVMVEPDSGEVRGVRIEGIRVDTDIAQYGALAWDGYNDRTAMFDRRTKQLVVDNRTDNSIVAFDLAPSGVTNAEGLEFVFRPTPLDQFQAAASRGGAHAGVSNYTNPNRYGSAAGFTGSGGGGGGGNNGLNPFDPEALQDLLDPPGDVPEGDGPPPPPGDDLPDDEFDDPPGDDPPGPPPPPDDPEGPPLPAPGGAALLAIGAGLASRRRRRQDP
jgi:hypothetical protein